MKLRRVSDQQPENLEAYYQRLKEGSQSSLDSTRFQAMIDLIHYLEAHDPDVKHWVYTTGEKLIFTNADHIAQGIEVEPGVGSYIITYPLPREKAPWEGALMEGATPDIGEAAQMISIALRLLVIGRF